MIHLRDIRKQYTMGEGTLEVLRDISMDIEAEEFVAIIGPSGSGKSTLMNIIGCLDIASSGIYTFEGEDISHCNDRQLATIRSRKIGFVFQQFHLLSRMSALENVELPMLYQNVPTQECRTRAEAALEKVGLADRMRHRPTQLSGGQQQRVAIARALVTRPALILADEPTGNLDSHSGADIMEMLAALHHAKNTVVLITHDANIASVAQRQIRIMDGRIESDERRAGGELLSNATHVL